MPDNLVQHRGTSSVWEREPDRLVGRWMPERWAGAALAGVCLASAVRRRDTVGWLRAIGAASIAWWAAGAGARRARGEPVVPFRAPSARDAIDDALEGSFPASDAPPWSGATVADGRPPAGCR